jgi:HPt (histidine-containing phosphotransfer) domain-containing protein
VAAVALDRNALARLTEEIGADGVAELIAMFAQETVARLQLIADPGLDREKRIREVHSLKGAAAATCAASLSRRATALEMQLKHDDTLGSIDTAPLVEAFDAWRAAVCTAGAAAAIAA